MGLNAKQKEAVEYLDGPLLVIAGPGTGKTQLLSHKVAYILKNTDTNPENILCMTFTETGAGNMRERLKTIIGKDGMKVNIGTYHAFGTDILMQYKNYADDYDRKLDSAIDEVTQYKIMRDIQNKLPGKDILRGDSVKDIISVISSAKSAGLSAEDLEKIAEQNMEDSRVLSEAISPLLENIVPRVFEESYNAAYKPIYETLSSYAESTPTIQLGTHSRPLDQAYDSEQDMLELTQIYSKPLGLGNNNFGSPKIERLISILAKGLEPAIMAAERSHRMSELTKWKNTFFEKDAHGKYRLKDRVANKKLASVARVMAAYDTYLHENGLYDFDDMIQEAVRVLATDTGFRLSMQEKYQYIMLDEFQDTNPSQFAIIKQLTDYEKPMLMAVGDDDQAIYEFQGALSTNLKDFKAHYNAHEVKLEENYRSTQEILDFSQKIIEQAPDRYGTKNLKAHKPAPASTHIYRHEFLASDMEYDFVAREISKLVKSGVKQSEIAVISYKTKYFMPLLPYLKSHPEIKIAYEKRDNLFEDEVVHEILTVARFVYEMSVGKDGGVSVLELLSYPFLRLPMLEVIKITAEAKKNHRAIFEYLAESDNEEINTVAKWLANLVAKSFTEPLEIMLDYIIGTAELDGYKSPLMEYYAGQNEYGAFVLYENLASLRGKLRKHFGEKSLKLADLVAMVDDYQAAEMTLNKTSPYKDADDAVQILSAHKAKGLEFEYVFIISADHVAWGKGKGNNNLLALPKNLAQIRHTGTTDGEKLRILYVALTRAKSTLYITNSVKDFNGKSPDRLEYLEEYTEGDEVISPLIPAGKVACHYDASAYVSSANTETLRHWLAPYARLTPDMRAIYRDRVAKWRMSASSLTCFVDVVYAGPTEFFKRYVLRAPSEPETEALAFGDLVHKTFEKVTNTGMSDESAVEYFVEELEKKDLPEEVKQKIREKGPADLAVSLAKFGEILRQGKAEVDLAPEKISVDGVPITGKIDHIIVDDEKKTIEIYDFKTGGYHKEKWSSHATLYKYMLQLGFYKLLLNNSPKYRKYRVEKAHILFVTPDKDDEVYDKVYEFNEEDEKELTDLMRTVYNMVVSLDFVDDAEIFRQPDNSLGIKDIKKFIGNLLHIT